MSAIPGFSSLERLSNQLTEIKSKEGGKITGIFLKTVSTTSFLEPKEKKVARDMVTLVSTSWRITRWIYNRLSFFSSRYEFKRNANSFISMLKEDVVDSQKIDIKKEKDIFIPTVQHYLECLKGKEVDSTCNPERSLDGAIKKLPEEFHFAIQTILKNIEDVAESRAEGLYECVLLIRHLQDPQYLNGLDPKKMQKSLLEFTTVANFEKQIEGLRTFLGTLSSLKERIQVCLVQGPKVEIMVDSLAQNELDTLVQEGDQYAKIEENVKAIEGQFLEKKEEFEARREIVVAKVKEWNSAHPEKEISVESLFLKFPLSVQDGWVAIFQALQRNIVETEELLALYGKDAQVAKKEENEYFLRSTKQLQQRALLYARVREKSGMAPSQALQKLEQSLQAKKEKVGRQERNKVINDAVQLLDSEQKEITDFRNGKVAEHSELVRVAQQWNKVHQKGRIEIFKAPLFSQEINKSWEKSFETLLGQIAQVHKAIDPKMQEAQRGLVSKKNRLKGLRDQLVSSKSIDQQEQDNIEALLQPVKDGFQEISDRKKSLDGKIAEIWNGKWAQFLRQLKGEARGAGVLVMFPKAPTTVEEFNKLFQSEREAYFAQLRDLKNLITTYGSWLPKVQKELEKVEHKDPIVKNLMRYDLGCVVLYYVVKNNKTVQEGLKCALQHKESIQTKANALVSKRTVTFGPRWELFKSAFHGAEEEYRKIETLDKETKLGCFGSQGLFPVYEPTLHAITKFENAIQEAEKLMKQQVKR